MKLKQIFFSAPLILSSIIFFIPFAMGLDLPVVLDTQDGFQVKVPAGWVSATPEQLQTMKDEMDNIFQKSEPFKYGYHPQTMDKSLKSPFVLIQMQKSGRPPENDFRQYSQVPQNLKRDTAAPISLFMGQFTNNNVIYDPANKILWKSMVFHTRSANYKVLFVFKLTELGMIKLTMYAPEEKYETALPLFYAVATNLVLGPELAYKTKWIEKFPKIGGINIVYLILIIFFLGDFAFIYYKFIKKKRGAEPEPEPEPEN